MIGALLTLAVAGPPLQAEVDALLPEVAEARGLPIRHRVRVRVVTPQVVRARTRRQTASPGARRELAATRDALVALRAAPADVDLRALLVDVMGDHLGGWYGPRRHTLTVVRREPDDTNGPLSPDDRLVIGHELVHALQDQHHHLVRLRRRPARSSDVELALLGLVEGDATRLDQAPPVPSTPLDALELPGEPSALERLPLPLVDGLLFPYVDGPAFAQRLLARGPGVLDAAFAAPPLSTEQVLHPDRYLAGDAPRWPDLPPVRRLLGSGWRVVADDAAGEIGVRSLLEAWGVDPVAAARGADGWGGDRHLVVRARDGRLAALWWTTWDTEADAAGFEGLAGNALALRRPADAIGDDLVVRQACRVLVGLDLPATHADRAVRALADAPVRVWTSRHTTAPEPR